MKLGGDWEYAGDGMDRRLVELGQEIMAVAVRFEQGAIGALHQHPHEQLIVVKAGKFKFSLGAEERIVQTGDTLYIAGDTPHGTVALEAGELLDIFTPLRLDMLESEKILVGSR